MRFQPRNFAAAAGALILALAGIVRFSAADVVDTPDDKSYMDDVIGGAAKAYREISKDPDASNYKEALDKLKPASELITKIADLKKKTCPKVQAHYITGKKAVSQFAENAAKNSECAISMYLGHGTGDGNGKVDPETIKKVEETIGKVPTPKKECMTARFGIFACWAKDYNGAIPEKNRIPSPWMKEQYSNPSAFVPHLVEHFDELMKALQTMCECCDNKVTLHLYFGETGDKKATESDASTQFSGWK
jgi:hypothetical protein